MLLLPIYCQTKGDSDQYVLGCASFCPSSRPSLLKKIPASRKASVVGRQTNFAGQHGHHISTVSNSNNRDEDGGGDEILCPILTKLSFPGLAPPPPPARAAFFFAAIIFFLASIRSFFSRCFFA